MICGVWRTYLRELITGIADPRLLRTRSFAKRNGQTRKICRLILEQLFALHDVPFSMSAL